MIRLTLGIGTLSPSLVQILHVTVKQGFSEFMVDKIVLLAQPRAQLVPRFGRHGALCEIFLKILGTPRARIKLGQSGHEIAHFLLLSLCRRFWIPSGLHQKIKIKDRRGIMRPGLVIAKDDQDHHTIMSAPTRLPNIPYIPSNEANSTKIDPVPHFAEDMPPFLFPFVFETWLGIPPWK